MIIARWADRASSLSSRLIWHGTEPVQVQSSPSLFFNTEDTTLLPVLVVLTLILLLSHNTITS